MTTTADLVETQVKDLLSEAGMLDAIDGVAPTVQLIEYREPVATDERVIMIRQDGAGGDSDEDIRRPSVLIAMFGKVDESPTKIRLRMEDILGTILVAGAQQRIIHINPASDVMGPYRTDTRRPVFEISATVIFAQS